MISEKRKEALRVAWMRARSERPWKRGVGAVHEIIDASGKPIGTMATAGDADLAVAVVNALPLLTAPSDSEASGELLATLAATIAAGIEANPTNEGRDHDFLPAERVASRAVEVARAILAEVQR